jgi:hypothetical protein
LFTPSRALRAAGTRGEPLPHLNELHALYQYGFEPRKGQMLMVAGQSGAAKTFFALWLAARWGVRTLYCSQDSDAHTMISRLISYATGFPTDDVSLQISRDPSAYAGVLDDCPIRFCFESLTIEGLEQELDAGVEVWDEYPELIVIDNLSDLDVGDETHAAKLFAMQELHKLRRTGAAVLVLHHTRSNPSGKNNWTTSDPQPRWEIDNKLDRKPEAILTVAIDTYSGQFVMSPVKNRTGKCTPDASVRFRLGMDLSRCNFYLPGGH